MSAATRPSFLAEDLAKLPRGDRRDFVIAGQRWYGLGDPVDSLWARESDEDGVRLSRRVHACAERGQVAWSWTMWLGSVWLEQSGRAQSIEAAAQATADVKPGRLQFEYLGQLSTWYSIREASWATVISGEGAEIFEHDALDAAGNPRAKTFRWRRLHKPAEDIIKLTGGRGIEGEAETLELAMAACFTAPDLLRAACGRWTCHIVPAPQEREAKPQASRRAKGAIANG